MAEDVAYLAEGYAQLGSLGDTFDRQHHPAPQEVAKVLHDSLGQGPQICPFALVQADLLRQRGFARLSFGDRTSEQRFAKACVIAAEAMQASTSEAPRADMVYEDGGVGYVERRLSQLEAGEALDPESKKMPRPFDVAKAFELTGRTLAVLRTQPRQLQGVEIVLHTIYLNIDTAAGRHEYLQQLVELGVRPNEREAMPAVVGLIASLIRNRSLVGDWSGITTLAERYVDYIANRHVGDAESGRDLEALMQAINGRRDKTANHLTAAMRACRDPETQSVLRQGLRPLKDDVAMAPLLELLRFPTCVDKCRTDLVYLVGYKANQPMTGFWSVVEWAQKEGVDLSESPQPE